MRSGPAAEEPRRHRGAQRQRRAVRRQAIDVLYQADVTGRQPADVVAEWRRAGIALKPDAEELLEGVAERKDDIDRMLAASGSGWTLARMAVLDRTILRVACYELLTGVPVGVAINEAVEMAKQLSTDESGRFVNGVLGRVAREVTGGSIGGARTWRPRGGART